MKPRLITISTAKEIEKQVSKVLRGLGNPEPPLDLEAVYQLLKLDPQFYRSSEDGIVRESISRVKVGTKLIIERPIRIWHAITKLELKALYVPDQRRVLIDDSLHDLKKRWNGAHEIGHSILDWHEDYTWGDTHATLSQACHDQVEAEANFAAGRLLFLQGKFEERVKGRVLALKELEKIGKEFGNSWTSTLYRAVEVLDTPAFCIIGSHPRSGTEDRFRYFTGSKSFLCQFGSFSQAGAQVAFDSYCTYKTKGPVGSGSVEIHDDSGERHEFIMESFGIYQGDVLTLGQWKRKLPIVFETKN